MLISCGKDVIIDDFVRIKRPELVKIGNRVAIDWGFYCTTSMVLGNYTHIGPHVSVIGGKEGKLITEGFNNIMSGARIVCTSDRFDGSGLFGALIPKEFKGRQMVGTITMEKFSNVGTNAIVLPNSRLRRGVLLTAGSLLIGDTEEWGVYKGNPAVLVKKIDKNKTLEQYRRLIDGKEAVC